MELQLSNDSPRNTSLCTPDGQTFYQIVTPKKLGARTTTVRKIVPNSAREELPAAVTNSAHDGVRNRAEEVDMRDRFTDLAVIEWPIFASDVLKYQGQEFPARSYLRPDGFFGRHRVFQGPDNRTYRWRLGAFGSGAPRLERADDDSKQAIAWFHPRGCWFFLKERTPAYLEISPDGMHMLDQIIITFIFVEKLRRERKRRRQNGGGGP